MGNTTLYSCIPHCPSGDSQYHSHESEMADMSYQADQTASVSPFEAGVFADNDMVLW